MVGECQMLPKSQFNKIAYKEGLEDFVYFATVDGLYLGSECDAPKKIHEKKDILCLTMWKNKLYAGTKKGEIINTKKDSVLHCRKGPIYKFIQDYEPFDISGFIGEYMVHEMLKPCSSTQEFWLSKKQDVYWHYGNLVFPGMHGIINIKGEYVKYTSNAVEKIVETEDDLWTVQSGLLLDGTEQVVTELPSDADSIFYHEGNIYYLRGTPGLEKMVLETHERKRLFPEHIITCFSLTKIMMKRPILNDTSKSI